MRRPALWLLLVLAAFLWGGEMFRRDLWEPDEARYAYVAREMRDGGHWLVPHRSGEFYAHKPPLLFWLINAGSTLTRLPIGRVTSRLPGFLAGLAALWCAARLARHWFGEKAAWPTVLVLCTCYLFWHEVGFGRIDATLLGLTMSALYLLLRNDDAPGWWRPALAYACMGLAVLAKGPVGFIVPAGAYAAARLAAGEGKALKKAHWLWGPLITLSFPAAWLGLAWRQGAPAGYFHELLYQQNIERAAGELGHRQHWYYFLLNFPADLLPWTLLLPAACVALWRESEARLPVRRLAGWIIFVVGFFTFMTSKRNIYVLGAVPAIALLIGSAWDSMARSPGRWVRGGIYGFLCLFASVGAGCLVAGLHPKLPIPPAVLWPAGVFALGGAAWMITELRRRGITTRLFYGLAVTMLLIQWSVGLWVYPAVNPLKTPVALAQVAPAKIPEGHPLLLYRINGEILALYAHRPGHVLRTVPELEDAMRREKTGLAVFKESDWLAVSETLRVSGVACRFKMGSKALVWFEFSALSTPQRDMPPRMTLSPPPPPRRTSLLLRFRRNTGVRRFGKSLERGGKFILRNLLRVCLRTHPVDPQQLPNIHRILFVRPNFRIGNLLISSALLPALHERFPGAEVDYLGADTTASLLTNYPFARTFLMSRSFILRPWAFLRTFLRLRKMKYDLAVDPSNGSFSAVLYMWLSGARYRMGGGRWAAGLCHIAVNTKKGGHAYDGVAAFAQALDVPVRDHPYYPVTPAESRKAIASLAGLNLAGERGPFPFIALFVGGHQDKRWPNESWMDLAGKLRDAGVRVLVLLGPEELHHGPVIRQLLAGAVPVLDPLPLRDFAAVLQQARLVVTPDSGPMHLAVALDVPVAAILQKETSRKFAPRGPQDIVLIHAAVSEVFEAIRKHSVWPALTNTAT